MRILMCALVFAISVGVSAAPPEPPAELSARSVLGPDAAAAEPLSQVLVVATPHLTEMGADLPPGALESLRTLLASYRPTAICIEHLPGEDIEEMAALGGAARQVAEMFAQDDLELAHAARRRLRCTRHEALARAEAGLAHSPELGAAARRELVADLVAADDLPTAVLQWSLLPPGERRPARGLPRKTTDHLDAALRSRNEIFSVALPLAVAQGLPRLISVDSQWDGARILSQPDEALEEAFGHPGLRAEPAPPAYVRQNALADEALRSGDLLPLYAYLNGREWGEQDMRAQWAPWLRLGLASGLHRLRYANWEERNARIATRVAGVTASPRPERVLVLIGAAHRSILEDLLGRFVHLRLVSFQSLMATGSGGGADAPAGPHEAGRGT